MGEILTKYRVDPSTVAVVGEERRTGGDGTEVMETPLYIAGDSRSEVPSLSTAPRKVQSRVGAALPSPVSTVTLFSDI